MYRVLRLLPSTVVPRAAPARAASGRSRYVRGGSNKQDITPEVRRLLEEAREPDDLSWQLGPGVREPLELDLNTEERTRAMQYKEKYKGYRSHNNGEDKVKYYPHEGEEVDDQPPSPVLMVTRVKPLWGEPYYYKDFCFQIGIGKNEEINKKVFLPNTPSVSLLLYRIKHLVEIKSVTFPNGMPDDFSPDTHGYKESYTNISGQLTERGEFIVTDRPSERLESIAARADWMKLDQETIQKVARQHWDKPWSSPLGNNNYYADNAWVDNAKAAPDSEKNKAKNKKWS